jgi:predicted PurR-regulated permease PerM
VRLILDRATSRKILNIVLSAILFYWALKNYGMLFGLVGKVAGPLTPLFIGAALAFVLNIPMKFFEGLLEKAKLGKFKRGISILLTITLLILILALVLFIVLPEIGRTFENLVAILPDSINSALAWFDKLTQKYPELNQWFIDTGFSLDNVGKEALDFLKTGGVSIANYSLNLVTTIISGTVSFFLGSVFATYILFEKENLSRQLTRLLFAFVPVHVGKRILEILSLTNRTFTKFVTGQLTEAMILGMMFVIAMSIFRFPNVIVIGVLVTITALVPIFGAYIAMFVGAFLILVISPIQAFWFMVMFQVLQQIEGNLIYPRVVGNSIGLPGMWVLGAVLLGASLYGIVGILLSVPLCSVAYILLRETVAERLKEKKLFENSEEELR